VKDILAMFFKQYMVQVLVASAIAFPIGYALMKRWLENYSRQTDISIWVFLTIFTSVVLLVSFCIGYRVWKAANENPADVVKSE
jgi:heme/copper-type cytochrome/quinol oxidase subunit 2